MYAFIGLGSQEMMLIFISLGVLFLLPFVALIDVVRSDFQGKHDKLIWVIIIIFTHLIGAILYLIFGRKQRIV